MKTKQEILALAREVEKRQRGEKRDAIERVIDAYEVAIQKPQVMYSVVDNKKCAICGGVILQKQSIFPMITPGGNPIRGCVVCGTMSWDMHNKNIVNRN